MPTIIHVYHKCIGNDRPSARKRKPPPQERRKKHENRPNAHINPIIYEYKYINIHNIYNHNNILHNISHIQIVQ